MDYQEKQHQKAVEGLAKRLLEKNYDAVLIGPTYCAGNLLGELDVLAIRGEFAHYYEVKCHDTYNNRKHAGEQINRAKRAFPQWKLRGVYFSADGRIKRYK